MITRSIGQVIQGLKNPARSVVQVRCQYDNLGDIMVAKAIQEMFAGISFLSGEPSRKVKMLDATLGVRRVFRYTCLGGGTLIFAPHGTGWLESLQYFLHKTAPLCTIGTGVIDPEFRRHLAQSGDLGFTVDTNTISAWIDCLRKFRFVSVRGVESQRILRENGLDSAEIIGDPALFYSRDAVQPKKRLRKLGVNLSTTSSFWNNSQAIVFHELTHVIFRLAKAGWRITLFPTEQGDIELAKKIVAASDEGVLMCDVHDRPDEFIDRIGQQDLFIGTKLHSVICAFCSYTPAIMIGYQPKCLDFMRTLGFEQYWIRSDRLNADHVLEMVEQIYADLERIQQAQFQACRLYKSKMLDFRDRVIDYMGLF